MGLDGGGELDGHGPGAKRVQAQTDRVSILHTLVKHGHDMDEAGVDGEPGVNGRHMESFAARIRSTLGQTA
jgi:hypothetical protein